jgi:threonine aldolase
MTWKGFWIHSTKHRMDDMNLIDLRSDTVTKPTPEMREVIMKAEVGDDVYGEDPTVNALEKESARILGKEAGLFIPSGTMGNLAAIIAHCDRGSEVILGDRAHTFLFEVGGIAALGGIQTHVLPNQNNGTLKLDDIREAIRSDDIHEPPTQLITLENTHNRCGGAVLTPDYTREIGLIAKNNQLKFHLDGARIFNAAVALDVDPAVLAEPADSVMFCLSKGLGAPIGSILCGEEEFIRRTRKIRKMLGGGMRQAGLIAAAGLYALENHLPVIKEDHRRARELARGLRGIDGLILMNEVPPSNMVYVRFQDQGSLSVDGVVGKLRDRGILVGRESEDQLRLVVHLWISDDDILKVIQGFGDVLG